MRRAAESSDPAAGRRVHRPPAVPCPCSSHAPREPATGFPGRVFHSPHRSAGMSTEAPATHGPHLEVDPDGIALVTFDDPQRRVNVLTEPVMEQLEGVVAQLEDWIRQGEVEGVLFRSGKPGHFIAGADVDAIARIDSPEAGAEAARRGQALYLAIERLQVPTAAAIAGTCMGGGTELALACRYRYMADAEGAKIGLPEVQLGILPAWGGTTRLPRLLGLQGALDLLHTGRPQDPAPARRRGHGPGPRRDPPNRPKAGHGRDRWALPGPPPDPGRPGTVPGTPGGEGAGG
ncbi:MAG: hypothetical protein EA352_07255 [Gemmatimonadales bacterium]|nr:MAG: hypothetical protein EA352_07255 [Gemmatimonadales bacterium]